MAKQAGLFVFEGTVGDATGYKMNGKYYLKTKSKISRRRIRKDDRFSNTRRNAKWFGEATKLARKVYRELPRNEQGQHTVWYPMRNRAQELVRKELSCEEIIRLLRKEFVNGESSMVNGESSMVKRESEALHKQGAELRVDELPDEILLGRAVNRGVELLLTDQLAASVAFVKNILREKVKNHGIRHKEFMMNFPDQPIYHRKKRTGIYELK